MKTYKGLTRVPDRASIAELSESTIKRGKIFQDKSLKSNTVYKNYELRAVRTLRGYVKEIIFIGVYFYIAFIFAMFSFVSFYKSGYIFLGCLFAFIAIYIFRHLNNYKQSYDAFHAEYMIDLVRKEK